MTLITLVNVFKTFRNDFYNKNQKKYIPVNIILILKYGSSTGFMPSHVKNKKHTTKFQKLVCFKSILLNWVFCLGVNNDSNIKIEANSAITPPNLFGIERRIAYANKKYHSG